MPRKKRTFTEGFIQRIYNLFFKPLVINYKPEDLSVVTFLENLFDVDYRSINRFKSRRSFKIPGLLYVAGATKVQGTGYRNVKKDSLLIVRENTRTSTFDVEFHGAQGKAEQVFHLDNSQWNSIATHLQKLD